MNLYKVQTMHTSPDNKEVILTFSVVARSAQAAIDGCLQERVKSYKDTTLHQVIVKEPINYVVNP